MSTDDDDAYAESLLEGLERATWFRREAWSENDIVYGTRLEAVVGDEEALIWFIPPLEVGADAAPEPIDGQDEWSWRVERIGDNGFEKARVGADVVHRVMPAHWRGWMLELTERIHFRLQLLVNEVDDAEYLAYVEAAEDRLSDELARVRAS